MVEQGLNDVLEYLRERQNIPLPSLGEADEPIASNVDELATVLGATPIDDKTFEPIDKLLEGEEIEAAAPDEPLLGAEEAEGPPVDQPVGPVEAEEVEPEETPRLEYEKDE